MTFAAPIWLLMLVPWAVVSLWLMLGRRQRVKVPFIELWQSNETPPRDLRASLRPPPFALACLLLSMQLGLLAAARPAIRLRTQEPTVASTQPKPTTTPSNVGIVRASARALPRPAVMVRLRNQSDQTRATLQVQTQQCE